MPSETFTHRATAAAGIQEVWAALDQPSTWESIQGIDRVTDPEVDADGRLQGFSFDSVVAGTAYRGTATPALREEGRLMAWEIENSEITGRIEVLLGDLGERTQLDVTLEAASKGMLSSMFFPVISKAIGNGFPRSVDEFAASFT